MDKGVIYGLLEDYINNANRQQIYMDIINSITNGQVKFDILDKNISRIIKITDFCILPNYISYNFY